MTTPTAAQGLTTCDRPTDAPMMPTIPGPVFPIAARMALASPQRNVIDIAREISGMPDGEVPASIERVLSSSMGDGVKMISRASILDDCAIDLRFADLIGIVLIGGVLNGVDFRGADMRGADLRRSILGIGRGTKPDAKTRNADFRGANLCGVDLCATDSRNADFRGASLVGADLSLALLDGADFRGADLSGADLRGATISCANLTGSNLDCAMLDNTK